VVRIEDTLYVGRYQTYVDYVPTNWEKDHLILARSMKHFIYLKTPSGEEIFLSGLSSRRMNLTADRHDYTS